MFYSHAHGGGAVPLEPKPAALGGNGPAWVQACASQDCGRGAKVRLESGSIRHGNIWQSR